MKYKDYEIALRIIGIYKLIEAIAKSQNKTFQEIEEELNCLAENDEEFDLIKTLESYDCIIELFGTKYKLGKPLYTEEEVSEMYHCPEYQKYNESCIQATEEERKEFFRNNYKKCINAGGKNETRTITKNILRCN